MKIRILRSDLSEYIKKHGLEKKWEKAKTLFEYNIKHPSLNTELLEPTWRGVYSFRIDIKYRALFFIDENEAEVFQITKHYKK
jgi:Txe/YoeB family toxin of Txe-Axe toxin-antitoxin module